MERRLDGDRAGHVHETWTDKCESGGALTDGCDALSFERGVNGCELPTRRRRLCPNSVIAAIEVYIFHDVASVVHARETSSDVKVHVREERVLSVPSAHTDSTSVTVTDLDVQIAHRGVERAGTRVTWRAGTTRTRIDAWCCCRCTARSCTRARAGEEDHVLFLGLVGVARRVLAKHEHRPPRTKSDHSNSSPYIHCSRQPVTTRRHEDNAF